MGLLDRFSNVYRRVSDSVTVRSDSDSFTTYSDADAESVAIPSHRWPSEATVLGIDEQRQPTRVDTTLSADHDDAARAACYTTRGVVGLDDETSSIIYNYHPSKLGGTNFESTIGEITLIEIHELAHAAGATECDPDHGDRWNPFLIETAINPTFEYDDFSLTPNPDTEPSADEDVEADTDPVAPSA